ncbi:CG34238, partial [Drosophila busckii]
KMQREDSLLYCAYAIGAFDLLCALLFAALSMDMLVGHLSWLTIFGVCFGFFWCSLILLLLFGIYNRNTRLVRYWLLFSIAGIFMELVLIVYAFMRETSFQMGLTSNSLLLFLGLGKSINQFKSFTLSLCLLAVVETVFVFIVYQFYMLLSKCEACAKRPAQK